MDKLTFIDLFGVPGGLSLGFKLAGMKPVGALDIFNSGIETYRKNFPEITQENIVQADASINNIVEIFHNKTHLKKNDVDILIGGPPCQGFSNVGRIKIASLAKNGYRNDKNSNSRFIDDKRNHLYKSFIKFANWFKPKAIVMENVPGMMSYKNGLIVKQIKRDFAKIGYPNVDSNLLNAVDYGVPQNRKRLFFVATKKNISISWPKKTHFPKDNKNIKRSNTIKNYTTVQDAIGDLPPLQRPKKGRSKDLVKKYRHKPSCEYQKWIRNNSKKVHNNITRWHRKKDIEVFSHMLPGSKWSELSKSDREKIGYSNESFNDKWKRLPNNKPSWTITSHLSKDGYMYIHPRQNRTISVREAARIQSFPDSFIFHGSRGAQFLQIGNAVPPLLSLAIAKNLKKILI